MKTLLPALAVLALLPTATRAQSQALGSVAINWDQCYGDGPVYNKVFACNTNTGFDEFVISATPPADIPALVAISVVVDLAASNANLAPWWNLDPASGTSAGCRAGPPSAFSVFFTPTGSTSSCVDPWQGQASGGSNYVSQQFGVPNLARLRMVCAVVAPVAVFANHELFLARVRISHTKTVGTGACAGCADPMCMMLNSVELDQQPGMPGGNSFLILPNPGTDSDLLTWQTGASAHRVIECQPPHCEKDLTCPAVTSTSRSTWGAIKSMYR